MERSALLSTCGRYRFSLSRRWAEGDAVLFIMLNPSTADANEDDPTIRRCIGFAKSWGFGALHVGNLFPFRATDPMELLTTTEHITHPQNIAHLMNMAESSKLVVYAWGNAPVVNRILKRKDMLSYKPLADITDPHYIDLGKDGTPKHPLYLPGKLLPKKFHGVRNLWAHSSLHAMRTLQITISDLEYEKFALSSENLSFSEFLEVISRELARQNLKRATYLAEQHGLSSMANEDILAEVKSARKDAGDP